MLNKELFQKVFNNIYLFRIVFDYINKCNKDNHLEVYKWNQLLQKPFILIKYNYFDKVIQFYINKQDTSKYSITEKNDLYNVLAYLVYRDQLDQIKHLLEDIIKIETIDLVKLYDHDDLLERAAMKGNFKIVKYLLEEINGGSIKIDNSKPIDMDSYIKFDSEESSWNIFSAVVAAPSSGNFELFKYLVILLTKQRGNDYLPVGAFNKAAESGQFEMFKYLTEIYQSKLYILSNSEIPVKAIRSGHFNILKYVKDTFPPNSFQYNNLLDTALFYNHIDTFHWLIENKFGCQEIRSINYSVAHSVEPISLEVYDWIKTNRTERFTSDAIYFASYQRNLEAVKWLHNNIEDHHCGTSLMDKMSEYGYLEIIEWLHLNCSAGCTTAAMDNAVKKGHLDVLKWLHRNRTEGCTVNALDNAIIVNNLVMVTWLHENRTEGLSQRVFDYIGKHGALPKMKWLLINRPNDVYKHIEHTMTVAAKNGTLELMKYLYDNDIAKPNIYHVLDAFNNNRKDLLRWILNTNLIPIDILTKKQSEFDKYTYKNHKSYNIIKEYIENNKSI